MGEVEKCPTCGSPAVTSWRLEQGQVLTQANGVVSGHYQRTVTHYEPLGLDALERSVVAEAELFRGYEKSLPTDEWLTLDADAMRYAGLYWRLNHLRMAIDALLAARAAHGGKEAGE